MSDNWYYYVPNKEYRFWWNRGSRKVLVEADMKLLTEFTLKKIPKDTETWADECDKWMAAH